MGIYYYVAVLSVIFVQRSYTNIHTDICIIQVVRGCSWTKCIALLSHYIKWWNVCVQGNGIFVISWRWQGFRVGTFHQKCLVLCMLPYRLDKVDENSFSW